MKGGRSRRAACAMLLALGCVPAVRAQAEGGGANLVREVSQRLADDTVLRGAFEQRKTVKGFRNPLVSTGDFVVARQRGVLWRTRTPFASTVVVTRSRVLARNADGSIARQLRADEEPAVRAISETLFSLMTADFAMLGERFRIEGEIGKEGWSLQLVPRDAAVSRWLQRVELQGDRYLRMVRLQEASGDATQISLSRHTGATALGRDEDAQFE